MPDHVVITRKIGSVAVNGFGARFPIPYDRGGIVRDLWLRLVGSITGGTQATWNAAANLGRGDEWGVFSRIDFVQNGGDYLRQFTGAQARQMMRHTTGYAPRLSANAGSAAAATDLVVDSMLHIGIALPRNRVPIDSALDSRIPSKLGLELTTDAAGNFATANAPTGLSLTAELYATESLIPDNEVHPEQTCRMQPIQIAGSATTVGAAMDLPTNCVIQGILVNCAAGTLNNSADKAYIYNVRLRAGGKDFVDCNAQVLREMDRIRGGFAVQAMQRAAANFDPGNTDRFANQWTAAPLGTAGTGPLLLTSKSEIVNDDAWLYIPLNQDGMLSEAFDARQFTQAQLLFDVYSGANPWTITAIPICIYPNPNPPPAK